MVLVAKQKRRSRPVAQKRRTGHHHKQDDRYLKPYWPYIPLVAIVAVGILFSSLWGVAAQHSVLSYATEMSNSNLLAGTNAQRAAYGLGSLAINDKLNQAAQAKANDMVSRNYWSHNTPDGNPPWTFFKAAGYDYSTAGENLAYGFATSDATITAWMNSPAHKENVLGSSYTEVGFGFANSPNFNNAGEETIVVAEYGSRASTAATTPTPPPTSIASKPADSTPTPATETPAASPAEQPKTEEKPAAQQAKEKAEEANATATPASNATPATTTPAAPQNITRLQLVSGKQATWSMFVVSTLAVVCVAVFVLRHGIFWHRMLVKGEKFVIHHRALDIALVAIIVAAIVLTRSAGMIR